MNLSSITRFVEANSTAMAAVRFALCRRSIGRAQRRVGARRRGGAQAACSRDRVGRVVGKQSGHLGLRDDRLHGSREGEPSSPLSTRLLPALRD